ncbi:hypothetical protein PAPYR_6285 [Paratrimastix pyriformis]|uniref:Uncharacterized protein n=1 Tax=Paratrimastix pyriformis TaxID=342808 RepID=A0ABQ8UJZ1_9EUKA|nr:hypothetical protein PAPYR_6285 [Paratrimastix pyriformis]
MLASRTPGLNNPCRRHTNTQVRTVIQREIFGANVGARRENYFSNVPTDLRFPISYFGREISSSAILGFTRDGHHLIAYKIESGGELLGSGQLFFELWRFSFSEPGARCVFRCECFRERPGDLLSESLGLESINFTVFEATSGFFVLHGSSLEIADVTPASTSRISLGRSPPIGSPPMGGSLPGVTNPQAPFPSPSCTEGPEMHHFLSLILVPSLFHAVAPPLGSVLTPWSAHMCYSTHPPHPRFDPQYQVTVCSRDTTARAVMALDASTSIIAIAVDLIPVFPAGSTVPHGSEPPLGRPAGGGGGGEAEGDDDRAPGLVFYVENGECPPIAWPRPPPAGDAPTNPWSLTRLFAPAPRHFDDPPPAASAASAAQHPRRCLRVYRPIDIEEFLVWCVVPGLTTGQGFKGIWPTFPRVDSTTSLSPSPPYRCTVENYLTRVVQTTASLAGDDLEVHALLAARITLGSGRSAASKNIASSHVPPGAPAVTAATGRALLVVMVVVFQGRDGRAEVLQSVVHEERSVTLPPTPDLIPSTPPNPRNIWVGLGAAPSSAMKSPPVRFYFSAFRFNLTIPGEGEHPALMAPTPLTATTAGLLQYLKTHGSPLTLPQIASSVGRVWSNGPVLMRKSLPFLVHPSMPFVLLAEEATPAPPPDDGPGQRQDDPGRPTDSG